MSQGAGFQSNSFLSPCTQSSQTSLHRKSWIVYHKRRIHWVIFVICCSLEITRKQDRCQYANKKRFKAFQKRLFGAWISCSSYQRMFFNVFSSRSRTTMSIKWGSNLSFCSCTIWRLHFCIWRPFFLWWLPKGDLEFFFNFETCCTVQKLLIHYQVSQHWFLLKDREIV